MIRIFSLVFVVLFFLSGPLKAQLNYVAADATVFQGAYNDLGNTGKAIITSYSGSPIEYDDTVSSVQNIGFSFNFNGIVFQQFVLSTNGFIRLGTAAPDYNNYDFNASFEPNIIAPFNIDLDSSSGAEYRVSTTGVQPNRVCIIQFKGLKDIALLQGGQFSNQFQSINFQIRLYETSNNIEFVYGSFVPTSLASAVIPVNAGIKGSSSNASVVVTRTSLAPWLNTSFLDGPYFKDRFNIRNSLPPQPGLTLRFTSNPRQPRDAMVSQIFSLSEMPLGYAFPHAVRARVKNMGLQSINNLPVYLHISGENRFTDTQYVSTLAPGAQADVTFNPFTAVKYGLDRVMVLVAPDDNPDNDSFFLNQRVNEGLYSYADSSRVDFGAGFGIGSGILSTRYSLAGKAFITGIRVCISGDSNSIGRSVYGVVQSPGGWVLGRSALRIIGEQDLKKYIELPLNQTIEIENGTFNAGVGCLSGTTSYAPIGAQFEGAPARSESFFISNDQGGGLFETTGSGRLMIQAIINSAPILNTEPVEICPGGNALLIEKGQGGVYQWQIDSGKGFQQISDAGIFAGSDNDSLTLTGIPSAWYGYKFTCLVDGIPGAAKSLRVVTKWVGRIDQNWSQPLNWSCGLLPDENTDVIITNGTVRIENPEQCRSLFTSPAVSMKILGGGKLNIRN